MRILDRYTLRQLIGPLVWCLALFVILYLVIDLFGHLDEILRLRVPVHVVARYYGSMLPLIFVQVAPFACLMAVLYTVGNLNRHPFSVHSAWRAVILRWSLRSGPCSRITMSSSRFVCGSNDFA